MPFFRFNPIDYIVILQEKQITLLHCNKKATVRNEKCDFKVDAKYLKLYHVHQVTHLPNILHSKTAPKVSVEEMDDP